MGISMIYTLMESGGVLQVMEQMHIIVGYTIFSTLWVMATTVKKADTLFDV